MKFVVEDDSENFDAESRFAVRLRALRQAKGLTQLEVAERMNEQGFTWHQTTVAKTERADRPLRLNEVEALALALGVPVVDLITDRPAVALSGPAAAAAARLDVAEQRHAALTAVMLEFARDFGKAMGEAEAIKQVMDKQQPHLDELLREVLEARDGYQQALAAQEAVYAEHGIGQEADSRG